MQFIHCSRMTCKQMSSLVNPFFGGRCDQIHSRRIQDQFQWLPKSISEHYVAENSPLIYAALSRHFFYTKSVYRAKQKPKTTFDTMFSVFCMRLTMNPF